MSKQELVSQDGKDERNGEPDAVELAAMHPEAAV